MAQAQTTRPVAAVGDATAAYAQAHLARRINRRMALGMATAAVDGAATVFLYLVLVLPPPKGGTHIQLARYVNAGVFAGYLALAVFVGLKWSIRRSKGLWSWYATLSPATEAERTAVVALPREQAVLGFILWETAAVLFGLVNIWFSARAAGDVASTIALAGLSMSALVYLLAERILRPVVARAFADGAPTKPSGVGVLPRILLTWTFCTGIPLLGIGLAFVNQPRSALPGLVAPTYFLVALGFAVGLLGMVIAGKSVSEPLAELRTAMARVGEGRTDVSVTVDDVSEIGMLQAGFNTMVDGLRERQLLADLFGRHVGVEVAREALQRDVGLGGETCEAAVLFIDVVGSTALATALPPAEVVGVLNAFFGVVVSVVERHGGWVNKFEGDAALCIFGVPVQQPNSAASALAAARELRSRLRDVPRIDAGIGVTCGTVVAGNVGAEARYEYTVIGDPVNAAARLSEIAKGRQERLVASAEVVETAGSSESVHWSVDGAATLRGRARATTLAVPAAP
ncbi:MAG: adenylate/guanylate cyclase domain-containing protein [Actinomycetes bacterium]